MVLGSNFRRQPCRETPTSAEYGVSLSPEAFVAGPLFMAMHGEDIASNRTVPGRFRIAAACFTALEVGGPAVAAGSTRLLARAVPRNSTTQVMAMRAGLAIGRARYALNTPAAARLQAFAATTGRSGAAHSRSLTLSRTCASDMIVAANSATRYVYDARVGRYRDVATGRFAAARDLPWPKNAGFAQSARQTVRPGTILDRYGTPSGRFLGEPGASVSARGMAAGTEGMPYTQYRVLKPFEAQVGPAAAVPEFGAMGGATQYLPGESVQWLVDQGFLGAVK